MYNKSPYLKILSIFSLYKSSTSDTGVFGYIDVNLTYVTFYPRMADSP